MSLRKIPVFKFTKPINIYAFTDCHIGSKQFDSVKFNKAIKALKADLNGYCFFNGDNLEFIPPNYGIPEGGQAISTDEQIEVFTKLVKSLGKKVLFIRSGNHEERAWRLGGVEINKHIGRECKVRTLSVGMEEVQIWIGPRKYRLITSHGEGGGSQKVLTNMQLAFPGADLYFSGHTHEFYADEGKQWIDTSSGNEKMRSQIRMVGGSFLGWSDYARSKNMVPTQTGCFILRLDREQMSVRGKLS